MAGDDGVLATGRAALILLLCTAFVPWVAVHVKRWRGARGAARRGGDADDDVGERAHGRDKAAVAAPPAVAAGVTTPYDGSLPKTVELLDHVMRLAAVLLACMVADAAPFAPHGGRTYDRDTFVFLCMLLLLVCAFTVKPGRGAAVLNRDQTEEWKGWMQFAFVAYHYYHAVEVYNLIRVFVSAYVWMTGFGNFSFFYTKADFTFVRMWRMLWRLNFSVMFLMLAMGNSYLLYYIVPLHTFYFLVVYLTMATAPHLNRTKWGIRGKLAAVAIVIYLVWEIPAVFDALWGLLEQLPNGLATLRDWHYRCFLDHYSTFFGMLFALNFPITSAWFKAVEGASPAVEWGCKLAVAAVLLGASAVWAATVLPLPKLAYNRVHPYFVVVPIITWIYLRNISRTLRKYHLHGLAWLGKITLETYLLQHHLLLTSNAKTVLVVMPGFPRCNLLLVACGFLLASYTLFRVTMELRFLLIPDDTGTAARIAAALLAVLASYLALGATLTALGAGYVVVTLLGLLLGGAAVFGYTKHADRVAVFFRPGPWALLDCGAGKHTYQRVATANGVEVAGSDEEAPAVGAADGKAAAPPPGVATLDADEKAAALSHVANGQASDGDDDDQVAADADAAPKPAAVGDCSSRWAFATYCKGLAVAVGVVMCLTALVSAADAGVGAAADVAGPSSSAMEASLRSRAQLALPRSCRGTLNSGHWVSGDSLAALTRQWLPPPLRTAGPHPTPPTLPAPVGEDDVWLWQAPAQTVLGCGLHRYTPLSAFNDLLGTRLLFVGDSHARTMFLSMLRLLQRAPTVALPDGVAAANINGHRDVFVTARAAGPGPVPGDASTTAAFTTSPSPSQLQLAFLWRPYLDNVTAALTELALSGDQGSGSSGGERPTSAVIVSAGQWDALHDPGHTHSAAAGLASVLRRAGGDGSGSGSRPVSVPCNHALHVAGVAGAVVTTLPTPVPRLMRDPVKQARLTEPACAAVTTTLEAAGVWDPTCVARVRLGDITRGRDGMSSDGVHYSQREYDVALQLSLNAVLSHPPPPRLPLYNVGGSLLWGLGSLALAAAMLATLDAYAGAMVGVLKARAAAAARMESAPQLRAAGEAWRHVVTAACGCIGRSQGAGAAADRAVDAATAEPLAAAGSEAGPSLPEVITWEQAYGPLHATLSRVGSS